jgi:hypothetical protein
LAKTMTFQLDNARSKILEILKMSILIICGSFKRGNHSCAHKSNLNKS